ncbi:MAG TPA: hypothetical protein VJT73_14650, partial [Polyangiaceae bacterium]|nr:hypothetical protein [Polyangiaceae bacterium]
MSVVSIAIGIRRLGRLATIAGVAMLAACSAPATDDGHEASGALRGELVIVVGHDATEADARIDRVLRVDGSNDRVHLRFDTVPDDLQPRAHLRVWGRREGARFDVAHYEQVPGNEGSLSSPLLNAMPVSPSIATVLVDINQTGVTKTKEDLTRVFASRSNTGPLFSDKAPGLSMAQYYDAISYGAVRTTMDFFGPFPWSGNPCLNGDYDGLADAMRAKVGGDYDHYIFYYGAKQSCGPGWGIQGTAAKHLSDIWLNNITFASGPAEELGHNFGWPHTSSLKCAGTPMDDDLSKCTTKEYGDAYAVMGDGDNDAPAFEKWYAGYLSGCNAVRVRSSGTYTLLPIEKACNGIQALQIPMAKTTRTFTTPQGGGKKNPAKHFYLELREKIGMDSDMVPGVYVHVSDEVTVSDR